MSGFMKKHCFPTFELTEYSANVFDFRANVKFPLLCNRNKLFKRQYKYM